MQILRKGNFYGISKNNYSLEGLTIVNSSFYNFSNCPWHYHTNAHFAFTIKGTLTETHKAGKIDLFPGRLLYNHSLEPHCNSNYSENVTALHVDITENWFNHYEIKHSQIEGLHIVEDPSVKEIFFKVSKEVYTVDGSSPLAIESLILQAVNLILSFPKTKERRQPAWVNTLRDLLRSNCSEKITLDSTASELNVHPVYLCQQFPLFFKCSFGDYVRKLRIEKAVQLMLGDHEISLTKISYDSGFADQSHFIRTFKKNIGITPLKFRKYLS